MDAIVPDIAGLNAVEFTILADALAVLMIYNLLALDKAYNSPVEGLKSMLISFSPEATPVTAVLEIDMVGFLALNATSSLALVIP
jgi:hypothetical protein